MLLLLEFHNMGGTTQTVDKTQAANSLVNSSGSTSGAQSGATSASGTTNPWAPAQPFLSGILAQLQGQLANASLTPQENAALSGLAGSSGYIGQFLPQATDLANTLFAGGNAQAQAPIVSGAYQQYRSELNPYLQTSFLDPRNTPGFADALAATNADITNQVNGMFAGAGRDLSGLNQQALARGLSQGEGQLIANQYNQNVANQLGAMGSLYGAGNTTAGLLSSLNQQDLANRQAGLGVASTGQSFANMPYEQQLAAAATGARHSAADIADARIDGRADRRAGQLLRQHRRHVGHDERDADGHADRQHHRREHADDGDAVQSVVALAARVPADDGRRLARRRHPRLARRRPLQRAVRRIHGAGIVQPRVTGSSRSYICRPRVSEGPIFQSRWLVVPAFAGTTASGLRTTGQKPWREFSISPALRRAAACSAV